VLIFSPLQHRHITIAENRLHEEFVLKIVDRDELNFLNYLSSPQMLSDPRNHTVPFSHVTGIGHGKSIIAMPKLLPLDDIPLSSLQTAQCYNLLSQIVEGFTLLHAHGVVHMDLKSANIVIDTSLERLYIIDFGLAHKVNGPEDTVSGFRGTKQWVAPEIEDGSYAYSAIRADPWAVSELIRTVLLLWHKGPTPNDGLEEIYTQLLSKDPSKRPLLVEILSRFDFTGHERASLCMPPLSVTPNLYNHILPVH
jgi:serine/threonine protein kinase